jgi:hypothetical protein
MIRMIAERFELTYCSKSPGIIGGIAAPLGRR